MSAFWALALFGLSVVSGLAAAWHVRRRPYPVIDLKLLRISTFSVSLRGGTLFRLGTASLNYLLPVLLQVGFGATAFASGLLTVAAAIGSLIMKVVAIPILRRWGFRTVLIGNGILSAGGVLICAFFAGSTPFVLIFVGLFVGGFFRSLQYTALNSIAFADVSAPRMSAATSFSSMMQQISNGMGVAFAAVVLNLVLVLHGGSRRDIPASAIRITIILMAIVTVASCFYFVQLKPDAAVEVSGHKRAATPAGGAQASD